MASNSLENVNGETGERFVLDCKGLHCPMSLYKMNVAMKNLLHRMEEHGQGFRTKLRKIV